MLQNDLRGPVRTPPHQKSGAFQFPNVSCFSVLFLLLGLGNGGRSLGLSEGSGSIEMGRKRKGTAWERGGGERIRGQERERERECGCLREARRVGVRNPNHFAEAPAP